MLCDEHERLLQEGRRAEAGIGVDASRRSRVAQHSEPSRSAFEQHEARMKRFQEITKDLLRLAEENGPLTVGESNWGRPVPSLPVV